MILKKIISGGQTGADRGALDAAIELGFPYGGRVPKGRRAEDGEVPSRYALEESEFSDYKARTRDNVRDSTATLIVCPSSPMTPGSKVTVRFCHEQEKPVMVRDASKVLADPRAAAVQVAAWIKQHNVSVLNVAGARESKCKGLQEAVCVMITAVLVELNQGEGERTYLIS